MKVAKTKSNAEQANVLRELQRAIVAGVTDDEIDLVATAAVRDLLSGAEQPLTGRELAPGWAGGRTGT